MVRAERGYTLVVCAVAVTLLSIAVAAALPLWSTQIQREKEEELVFRGLQYAEAVRVFQRRVGRPPTTLQELHEVHPRSIRQLTPRPGGQPPVKPVEPVDPEGREPAEGVAAPRGPIIGVRSRSNEEGLRLFFGRERYSEWQFTVDLLATHPPAARTGRHAGGAARRLDRAAVPRRLDASSVREASRPADLAAARDTAEAG
jgi:type II secretory pathway pseudopilin PulG